jgi:hypothetical protein
VEVDPPTKRRKRGRAVYPTPIGDEDAMEDEQGMRIVSSSGAADQSLDEDDQERQSELARDADVEATSDEDLPEDQLQTRPMGGVSASLSSTLIGENDEEEQRESHGEDEDAEQDHRDEIPEAHESAAETTTFRRGQTRDEDVDLSTEGSSVHGKKRALRNRTSYGKPVKAAPGRVNVKKAKAGVVKTSARRKAGKTAAKSAKKSAAKKAPAKKAAPKKATAKRAPAKKVPAKKKPAGKRKR